jgi:hypothetical protein
MSFLFHYTTRAGAQAIKIEGVLRPGASGWVYLTPDAYDTGWIAAQRLATHPDHPREVVFAIERESIERACSLAGETTALEAELVEPLYLDGRLMRGGGGAEVKIATSVPIPREAVTFACRTP